MVSRTQRSTKLSHASISIKFSPQNYGSFRICGIICGRSGIFRYFLNTMPPIKWLFVRSCRSSADFTLTVRYGIPNSDIQIISNRFHCIQCFLFRKVIVFGTLFSTVSVYSIRLCGIKCGRKNNKNFKRKQPKTKTKLCGRSISRQLYRYYTLFLL